MTKKFDGGKLRLGGLFRKFPEALRAIAEGDTQGTVKYGDDNWKTVPNPFPRYEDAAMRHILAYFAGERVDPESGEHHLSHAAWNLIVLIQLQHELESREVHIAGHTSTSANPVETTDCEPVAKESEDYERNGSAAYLEAFLRRIFYAHIASGMNFTFEPDTHYAWIGQKHFCAEEIHAAHVREKERDSLSLDEVRSRFQNCLEDIDPKVSAELEGILFNSLAVRVLNLSTGTLWFSTRLNTIVQVRGVGSTGVEVKNLKTGEMRIEQLWKFLVNSYCAFTTVKIPYEENLQ